MGLSPDADAHVSFIIEIVTKRDGRDVGTPIRLEVDVAAIEAAGFRVNRNGHDVLCPHGSVMTIVADARHEPRRVRRR